MALASRGLRDMDDGPEELAFDEEEIVREQARKVRNRSVFLAALFTVAVWFLP